MLLRLKVGDTIADIKEGVNAGIDTVGIIEGSSLMGLSQEEYEALSEENPLLYEHLSAAMRATAIGDLWPPIKNRKEMKPYYYQFFKNQQK